MEFFFFLYYFKYFLFYLLRGIFPLWENFFIPLISAFKNKLQTPWQFILHHKLPKNKGISYVISIPLSHARNLILIWNYYLIYSFSWSQNVNTSLFSFFLLCFDSVANNWLPIAFVYYNSSLAFSWLLWHWYFLTVKAICSAESPSVNLSEYVFIITSCLNILARMFSRWWALLIAHNIRLLCYQCCEFDFSILFHIHPTNFDNVVFLFLSIWRFL